MNRNKWHQKVEDRTHLRADKACQTVIAICSKIEGKIVRRFPNEFVLHSLRHTCLRRLGQTGADAFTIMKLAGHSSVTISQRYVHPTGETVELAFSRLEALNERALKEPDGEE